MLEKHNTPEVSLVDFKRTKMIATVGPATNSYEQIDRMLKNGVNGFRLNFSHGLEDERAQQIGWIRRAAAEYGKPVAIIQDLQGPKIRLGDFDGMIAIEKGHEYCLEYKANYLKTGHLPTQYDLSKKVKRGDPLKIYDGKIKTHVTSVRQGKVYVRAENAGIVTARKGINAPDTDFGHDIFTAKDKKDVLFGIHHDVDYVALSFVQTADNIRELRRYMKGHGSDAKIIAKIETKAAVDNLDEIIKESDAVMVARGDLAIETSLEKVPVLSRSIIGKCQDRSTISIVATQMLASMTETPEPTRAEVSDVATAVIVGADAVMLSDETAMGKYPIEAVKIMKDIIVYTQNNPTLRADFFRDDEESLQEIIASSAISLATAVNAKAIIAETKSGATAISLASNRPNIPIIMVTDSTRTAQQLAIVYGGKSYVRPVHKYAATKLTDWLHERNVFKPGDIVVTASGRHPGMVGATDTIKIRRLE